MHLVRGQQSETKETAGKDTEFSYALCIARFSGPDFAFLPDQTAAQTKENLDYAGL
jgi:hypothetical protein